MTAAEFLDFVRRNNGASIEVGGPEDAPSLHWIAAAEAAIGQPFPPSYRAFLLNFGGGTVHGDEIFSVYEIPLDQVVGGDVARMTLGYRRAGFIAGTDIAICRTDFDETFVLDTTGAAPEAAPGAAPEAATRAEYPVHRLIGRRREPYAQSFADFIVAFVDDAAV